MNNEKIFLTGSRAYGIANKDSDIDLVMLETTASTLHNLADSANLVIEYNQKLTYHGFYFTIPGLPKINIIAVKNEKKFNSWAFVTEHMKSIDPIKDRDKRIKYFKQIRERNL